MEDETSPDILTLTAGIVSAHVGGNSVHAADVPKLISAVHGALASLGSPPQATGSAPGHKAAVIVRKSLASNDHIVSMIDGKPYRTLRRHLRAHGLTDQEYRTRYNLPANYPMVAKAYSAARSAMSLAAGFGKAGAKIASATKATAERVEEVAVPENKKAHGRPKRAQPASAEVSKLPELVAPARKRRSKSAH